MSTEKKEANKFRSKQFEEMQYLKKSMKATENVIDENRVRLKTN
jgi:hypothetical protein